MRDWTENQIMLAFIRHGATQANKERRYLGKTDESLSEEGIEILESYKMQKLYPDVEYLFTSPMKRCTETAKIIYPTLCPVVIPDTVHHPLILHNFCIQTVRNPFLPIPE